MPIICCRRVCLLYGNQKNWKIVDRFPRIHKSFIYRSSLWEVAWTIKVSLSLSWWSIRAQLIIQANRKSRFARRWERKRKSVGGGDDHSKTHTQTQHTVAGALARGLVYWQADCPLDATLFSFCFKGASFKEGLDIRV